MSIRNSSFVVRFFSVLIILSLLVSAPADLSAQAKSLARPPLMSGDFLWARGMGGTLDDQGTSIAVDSTGNVYTTGAYSGSASFGVISLVSAGGSDIFVTKMDSSGNYLWAKSMGGTGDDLGRGIAVDSTGNVYTTGHFYISADFNPNPASTSTLTSAGSYDIFISKLDSSGNFVWAKRAGGLGGDSGVDIAVDSSSNAYITGAYVNAGNGEDIYVSKLDSSGNTLWSKILGGTGVDYGLSIAVDLNGIVYITGAFEGTANFGSVADPYVSAGLSDIFISKYDTNGTYLWARSMGGTGADFGYGITVDSGGYYIFVTGDYNGTAAFSQTANLTSAGGFDIFIAKYDSSKAYVWAKSLGGSGTDYGMGIAVDSNSNIYTTGAFSSTASFDSTSLTSAGAYDIFVNKLNSNGDSSWTQGLGGSLDDTGAGIALSSTGILTTGVFRNVVDFDPGVNTLNLTSAGSADIFVSKLKNYTGVYYVKPTASGTGSCESWANACTLQRALSRPATGDTLWVAQGTYKPTAGADRSATFQLKSNVGVYGGFVGTETTIDQRNSATHPTILSGDLLGNDNGNINPNEPTRSDNSYHVLTGATANLDGFTITAGNANGASLDNMGGGMLSWSTAPFLTNVTFSKNTAGSGGGIYDGFGGALSLDSVTFTDNAAASGGAMAIDISDPILTNVTFSGNTATNSGGAIFNWSSDPVLTNVTFSGNSALQGGGIYNQSSYPHIRNSIFWGNTASNYIKSQIWNDDGVSVAYVYDSIVQFGISFGSNSSRIITTDPKLGVLGNYGGSTQIFPLLAGSSAINMGDNATCAGSDQRSVTRPQGGKCDMGAYEYNYAGVFYVKPIASGTGDCQSWLNACILQTALLTAASGDTIWVRQGTHKPIAGTDRAATFKLTSGVAVYGGFAGTETALAQRNPAAYPTILSGDLVGNDNGNIQYNEPTRADNSYTVVTGATGATLDGFTITAGNANGVNSNCVETNSCGGGMLNISSSPTLANLIFSSNTVSEAGAGMANLINSSPTLTNITFTGNNANFVGGGMENITSSNPVLTNVTFSGNSASSGGGICNSGSSPTLTNVTFSGNAATGSAVGFGGAGLVNYWTSNPTLTNVTFSGNTSANVGGAMYNVSSPSPHIRNTIFWGNTAVNGGAQISNDTSYPAISDSVVQGGCPLSGTCMNIIVTDPKLGTLGNYGGFTQTIPLQAGSSAINTADEAVCPATDQRGLTRPQALHCDIGAYEFAFGNDTTGVFRPSNGLLYLKNANTTGWADVAINYGTAGDYPVAGDWDGNGTTTIGIYRNGIFYLRNTNSVGFADLVFAFGQPGDQPVAGDWNGDGIDTIGVFRSGQFLLRNSNSAGAVDMSFYLGNPGDVGIAGDWNGDGLDTTGVFRPSNGVIFLKNTNASGFADVALNYGLGGDRPVIGDWDNDGIDTIGVYRNAQFLLRNSNSVGFADLVFAIGNPGDMPISGNWDALP